MDEIKISDLLTMGALIIGPAIGVILTIWKEGRKEKLDSKKSLFFTLIANRRWTDYPSWDFVIALNQIEFIFYDVPSVVQAWREYYNSLRIEQTPENQRAAGHCLLNLLHEMAIYLKYPKVRQTDLDR